MMKTFHIENPCEEKWEKMQNISNGKFCDLCSKTVLDLTQKSDKEILQILEDSNGKVCGRISKTQYGKNIFTPEKIIINQEKTKGYSRLVAGLAIAASLTGMQTHAAAVEKPSIHISENRDSGEIDTDREKISDNDFVISGKLISSDTGKPLANIEVTFITKEKIFQTKTDQTGNYRMTVPDNYIRKNRNVLRFDFGGHYDKDFILNKEELKNKNFSFDTPELYIDEVIFVGAISTKKTEITYLLNGEEITEEEFKEFDKKDFKILYFSGSTAKTLYSDTSEDGLYLVFSK